MMFRVEIKKKALKSLEKPSSKRKDMIKELLCLLPWNPCHEKCP